MIAIVVLLFIGLWLSPPLTLAVIALVWLSLLIMWIANWLCKKLKRGSI